MKTRHSLLIFVLIFALLLTACSTWPTIIATAESLASITTIFEPGIGALSALAVSLLESAESAATVYNKSKSTSTEQAYIAAIQDIETRLPDELQKLRNAGVSIPAADLAKAQATVNIILDWVEAEAAQVPATAGMVAAKRQARAVGPAPKRMTRAQIKARWDKEVCGGDAACAAKVK